MAVNVKLVLGCSCSGKETYMRHVCGDSGLHLSAEEFRQKVPPVSIMNLLESLSDNRGVTIEGFPLVGGAYLDELREKHNVRSYIITYAPIFILEQRRQWGRENKKLPRVDKFYGALLKYIEWPKTTFYNTFENTHHKWTKEEFWADWERINCLPTEADEEAFLVEVRKEKDRRYAPIALPHSTHPGVTDPQATWERIQKMGVDVKGKRVIDIGCCEGFTLHRVIEAGAAKALGLDSHEGRLRNALKIAWLKQSPVDFLHFNIHFNSIMFANDMVLCLNMLHYTSIHISLPRIFTPTREAIFEITNNQIPTVKRYAKEHRFEVAGERGGRKGRTILWFKRRTK